MAEKDKNTKLADAIVEAFYDTRVDPAAVGHYMVSYARDEQIAYKMLLMFAAYCEFLAIRYDYGDFNDSDFVWLKQAAQIRDLIQEQSLGSAD